MRKFLYITGCVLTMLANAQQPFISSIDKSSGTANEIVTISGAGFASPVVYFGQGKVTSIVSSSANVIEVRVPATATYGPVTVVNDAANLSATSSQLFSLSFDNDFAGGTFSPPTPETPIASGDNFAYDLCLCDFDGDNLLDAVVTHDDGTNLAIELNQIGSPGTFTHSLRAMEQTNSTHYVECGDLNADGKPDLVITSSGAEPFIHIYQNTSTAANISFNRIVRIQTPASLINGTRSLKRVRLADIDGDGKPDVIVGNFLSGDNDFFVYLNTSSGGAVSFNTTENLISVPGASYTASLFPGDLNNDGKVDLAFLPFGTSSQIFIMENTSLPGSVTFESAGAIGATAIRWDLAIADFNNDGLNDIASTQNNGSNFSFVEISQNEGGFNFLNSQALPGLGGISLEGLAVGDMNGDGFADVVGASLTDDVAFFENTTPSNGNDITFATPVIQNSTDATRNIRVGDLNDDGKPDIAYTNNSTTGQAGKMGYILNDGCMTPVITPSTGTFCNPTPTFELTATLGHDVNYAWIITGDNGVSDNIPVDATGVLDISAYDPGVAGSIMVSLTATMSDNCTVGSVGPFTYARGDTPPGAPSISSSIPGLVCLSDAVTFTVTPNVGSATYEWTGPGGFAASKVNDNTLTVSAEWLSQGLISLDNGVEAVMSGEYSVFIQGSDCRSAEGTLDFVVSGPPVTTIQVISCNDGSIALEVPDFSSQFAYQWKLGGSNVGTNSPAFTATTSGVYTLDITDASLCTFTSASVVIPNAPVSSYDNPDFGGGATSEVCVGVAADFAASSTGDGSFSLGYTWEVEDPSASVTSSTGDALNFTFNTLGVWKVRLITEYTDSFGCDVVEKNITVSADPAFSIPAALTKCSADNGTVTLTGASTGNGDSWIWTDVNDLTNDLTASSNGDLITSIAGTFTATYTSGTGCQTTTSSIVIDDFPGIGVTATGSTFEGTSTAVTAAKRDTIIFVEDQTFVTLTADNSLGYTWTAATPSATDVTANIDDPSVSSVLVTPAAPVIIVTVSGQTLDACLESTEIVIISGSFLPRKSFSPNGDGLNDVWTINNSRNLEGCKVFIFDSRGATIFNEESPFPNDEIWDGNYKGKPATEGVYYYVLKCDDSENNQTGAILLSR